MVDRSEETPAGSALGPARSTTQDSAPTAGTSGEIAAGSRQEMVVIPLARLRSIESRLEDLSRTVETLQSNAAAGSQVADMVPPQTEDLIGDNRRQSLQDRDQASLTAVDRSSWSPGEFDWSCLDELLRGVEDSLPVDQSFEDAGESSI